MNDPLPTELVQEAPAGTYLVDAYEDWAKAEGVPVLTGSAIDLRTANVVPWARFDAKGAFCHVDGRCDFLSVFLLEIAAGKTAAPQRHLYEEICYVIDGIGETVIETPAGTRTVAWAPRSIFSMPMNARYRHRNTGTTPARIAGINDMRYLFNLFRNEAFVYALTSDFPERISKPGLASGAAGLRLDADAVKDLAVVDIPAASTSPYPARLPLSLYDGTISTDVWQIEPGTYTEAKRQFQGVHHIGISGQGYMVISEDGAQNPTRIDCQPGLLFSAPAMMYYQHFNSTAEPMRFITLELGSVRTPMFRHRRVDYGDNSVYAAGRDIIPYAKQDTAIRKAWIDTIAAKGIKPAL